MSGTEESDLFIGFDLSSQQLKASVLDDKLNLVCEESVVFDLELPEFRWVTNFELILFFNWIETAFRIRNSDHHPSLVMKSAL